jgi:hypothetical protein
MEDHMNQSYVQWCRNLFDSITDGGLWGIPACGLMFRKIGTELVLIDSMPHVDGMPCSAKELQQKQATMYAQTQQHFEAAGIKVRRMQ